MSAHAALAVVLVAVALAAKPGARWLLQVRVAMLLAVALVLTACAPPPPQIVKHDAVEVTKYVRTPIPAELVQPNEYAKPDPRCVDADGKRVFCNGQVRENAAKCEEQLNACNADKALLRQLNDAINPNSPPPSGPASQTVPTTNRPGAGEPAPGAAGGEP